MLEIKHLDLKAKKARDFYEQTPLFSFMDYGWAMMGCPEINFQGRKQIQFDQKTPYSIFLTSDLHLALNAVFEKQNCMVEGKYKKARVYLFESEYFYITAQCETGDRGSHWCIGYKASSSPVILDNMTNEAREDLGQFFRAMTYHILNNYAPYGNLAREENPSYVEGLFKEVESWKLHERLQEEVSHKSMENKKKIKI